MRYYPRRPINNHNTSNFKGYLLYLWRYWPRWIFWGYQFQRAASHKTTNSQHKMWRPINRLIVQWVSANAHASQKHHNKSICTSSSQHIIAQIQHNKSMEKWLDSQPYNQSSANGWSLNSICSKYLAFVERVYGAVLMSHIFNAKQQCSSSKVQSKISSE